MKNLVEKHYYTLINKIFLKILGIWPYDRSLLVFWRQIFIIIILAAGIIVQLTVFITMKYNLVLFVNIMSLVFPCTLILLKYCSFIFKSENIKVLHYYIQEDWKLMQNKLENDIMKKYARNCRNYVNFVFGGTIFLLFPLFIAQTYPVILDFFLPLDEPRLLKPLVLAEFFISQDDYIYAIICQEMFASAIFMLTFISTSTQLLLLAHHSFGMFKIARHRMEHLIDDNILYMPNCERAICEKIFHVVIIHRRCIEYCNIFTSSFNVPFCIFGILGVFSLSVNLFRFLQAISKNTEDTLLSFCTILGHLIYMFLSNYVGQKISDYNYELYKTVYTIPWYLMPVTSQKLILFLLQKTGKDFYYIIGLIFVAKIENFTMLVNTSLSYVTLMYSVQRE